MVKQFRGEGGSVRLPVAVFTLFYSFLQFGKNSKTSLATPLNDSSKVVENLLFSQGDRHTNLVQKVFNRFLNDVIQGLNVNTILMII